MERAGEFELRLFPAAEKSWAAISLHPKVIFLWDIPYGRYKDTYQILLGFLPVWRATDSVEYNEPTPANRCLPDTK
jgi:hypothetical protein